MELRSRHLSVTPEAAARDREYPFFRFAADDTARQVGRAATIKLGSPDTFDGLGR